MGIEARLRGAFPCVRAVLDEVVGPDVVRMLWSQSQTGTVAEPEARAGFGCRAGTLSPSCCQIRSTRFTFTVQSSRQSIGMIRP